METRDRDGEAGAAGDHAGKQGGLRAQREPGQQDQPLPGSGALGFLLSSDVC